MQRQNPQEHLLKFDVLKVLQSLLQVRRSDEKDLTANLCKLEWNVRMAILVSVIQ